jgi:hypothetical protein
VPTDREDNGDPRSELPELSGRLRPPSGGAQRATLANRLVPVVDRIRNLNAKFGLRPYRVFLVHAVSSSGSRGVGLTRIVSRREIEPTPRVNDFGSMAETILATGTTEEGAISIDEISAKFTEDDLLGRTADLADPKLKGLTADESTEFFWEVQEERPQRDLPQIRRFAVAGVPELNRGKFQWTVRLTKQDYDRGQSADGGF